VQSILPEWFWNVNNTTCFLTS